MVIIVFTGPVAYASPDGLFDQFGRGGVLWSLVSLNHAQAVLLYYWIAVNSDCTHTNSYRLFRIVVLRRHDPCYSR